MSAYRNTFIEHWMKRSEQEVHGLFNRYARQLAERKWEMTSEIDDWRYGLIRQIDNHAEEQKRLLEKEYQKQESFIDDSRNHFIRMVLAHETRGENEQIRQLLEQCKALKIELAGFEFPEHKNPFIQFMTDEQRAQKNRDERNAQKQEDNKFRNKTNEDYDNVGANNTATNSHSPPKSASTNSNQTNQPSTTTNPTNTHDRSINSDSNQNNQVPGGDSSDGKCPVCFMIFPLSMMTYDRQIHINEHLNH